MSTLPLPNAPSADEQPAKPLEYVQALWKRRWVIIVIAGMVCLASYAWTLKQPRIYQADCTLQYDSNPPRPLGEEVTDTASPNIFWETRVFFATQNRIIGSRAVAEKVVRKLSLHKNADFWRVPIENRARWKGATVAATAQRLQGLTTVTPERDTRIVHVLVEDRDPERAQLLANTLVDTYIEKVMADRLSNTTSALEWLGTQLDTLKTQLERSEIALHDFTGHHQSDLAVARRAAEHRHQQYRAAQLRADRGQDQAHRAGRSRRPTQAREQRRPDAGPREHRAAGHGHPGAAYARPRARHGARRPDRQLRCQPSEAPGRGLADRDHHQADPR